jgi:hypothetical protein
VIFLLDEGAYKIDFVNKELKGIIYPKLHQAITKQMEELG